MNNESDDVIEIYKNYDPSKNRSLPILSKYEKSQVLGLRAEQLSNGSDLLIEAPPGVTDVKILSRLELAQKKTPFIIKRKVGNKSEYFKIEDMEIDKD
jgi:DNA-directed RNA polymerase subunit K/omega